MPIKELSIDLETYCEVDLRKSGVYRYAEDDTFEILLLAVSIDNGPVTVYDLTKEELPDEILQALMDDTIIKWAFNASFERICLSNWLKKHHQELLSEGFLSPNSWRCSMVWSAYLGLPLSLEGVGTVLKLKDQKLKEGGDFIRYFCLPCKPTKVNGGRTRNFPNHAPDKWSAFIDYNKRDVEVELAIKEKLRNYPVPDFVWEEYHQDQVINDRGIGIDVDFVKAAIGIDGESKTKIQEELRELTGLENPNSVLQMISWLREHGVTTDSLDKKAVKGLLKTVDDKTAQVLKLRQQAAKSSVSKYQAMMNCVCKDGRARGMFQFYGANRTGRWAGRLVQLQNLPQNHLPDLEEARELFKTGDLEATELFYDTQDTLSQLIRTAFVPNHSKKFIVCDFSAIEARVLSHLAGEAWRSKVFEQGKDIYCMSASQMFGVPVEKHGQNSNLRQKGKIAELACIAEGELVLTNKGLVPIEQVSTKMKVWDGLNWVSHEGVIYKGKREVISYDGLTATPDHLVWIEGKSEPVPFGKAATSSSRLLQTGNGRRAIRLGKDHKPRETVESKDESLLCSHPMSGMSKYSMAKSEQSYQWEKQGLPSMLTTTSNSKMVRPTANRCKATMRKSKRQRLPQLRCQRHFIQVRKCHFCRSLPYREIWSSKEKYGNRPHRQQRSLRKRKSSIRYPYRKQSQQAGNCPKPLLTKILALHSECRHSKTQSGKKQRRNYSRCQISCTQQTKKLAYHQCEVRLYDIRNAGPHHRFTVSNKLVHNCGYGGSVGALKAMGAIDMGLGEDELQPLVDSWRQANPNIVLFWWDVDRAVKTAVKEQVQTETHGIQFEVRKGMLFITLPSGRKLAYVKPKMGENQFGGESVTYEGTGTAKRWERLESYGPKFVENIVQAISRDILAYSMKQLQEFKIVGHVHDEVIIECDQDQSLEEISSLMGIAPNWMSDINLRADGYECSFYQKD
ncbi:DNA polymerase [Streptococcus suis]